MHPLYTESERERGGGGIIPQGVARNLRNLVEHPGSSVDSRLVTNDFASIGVYIYIIRLRGGKRRDGCPDKTGSELLIVPVFDLRSYNGLIEFPLAEEASFFFFFPFFSNLLDRAVHWLQR